VRFRGPAIPAHQYDASKPLVCHTDLNSYVGATSNVNTLAPRLHVAIFLLSPEKRRWQQSNDEQPLALAAALISMLTHRKKRQL
jgi:hypothetical protein